MNIQAEKIQLMKMILETENTEILKSIKKLFTKQGNVDFWTSLSNEQKDDIDLGISEIEKGETIEYESVIKKHRK
jgi:hypothetical protein